MAQLRLIEGQADYNSPYPVGLRRSGLLAPVLTAIGQGKHHGMDVDLSDALGERLGKGFA